MPSTARVTTISIRLNPERRRMTAHRHLLVLLVGGRARTGAAARRGRPPPRSTARPRRWVRMSELKAAAVIAPRDVELPAARRRPGRSGRQSDTAAGAVHPVGPAASAQGRRSRSSIWSRATCMASVVWRPYLPCFSARDLRGEHGEQPAGQDREREQHLDHREACAPAGARSRCRWPSSVLPPRLAPDRSARLLLVPSGLRTML